MYGLYQIMYFTLIDIMKALCSPFFIALNTIVFAQYYQIGKSINKSKTYAFKQTFSTALLGMVAGLVATVIFIYLEVKIIPVDFFYILILALILSLKDPRFMCLSYAGSIITLLNLTIGFPKGNVRDIMQVVGVLHLMESILILINGVAGATIATFPAKGKLRSGYNINRFWPIPFLIFIGDSLIRPITLMAIINYSDFTFGQAKTKVKLTSLTLFIYSIIILTLINKEISLILVALYTIIFHEIIILANKKIENSSIGKLKAKKIKNG